MESARKGACGEGCARAALPPQGNAARPWRQGERRQQTRKRAGARQGAPPRAAGRVARCEHCRLGGQPPRTAGKRRTQQCAGAAALLCRHACARAPTADDVPTTKGGAYRRPEHGHETPGRHPRRTAGDALTGGFAREHLPAIYYLI